MVNNSKESAFGFATQLNVRPFYNNGLTKREYFAVIAMQGYFSNSEIAKLRSCKTEDEDIVDFAEISVKAADALLKALENNNSTETK